MAERRNMMRKNIATPTTLATASPTSATADCDRTMSCIVPVASPAGPGLGEQAKGLNRWAFEGH